MTLEALREAIQERLAAGESSRDIAAVLGCSRRAVTYQRRAERWRGRSMADLGRHGQAAKGERMDWTLIRARLAALEAELLTEGP